MIGQSYKDSVRLMRFSLLVIVAVALAGTLGYYTIEGWSLIDSFFMAVITLTTIGYGEVHPLDPYGKVFTILLILFGVGAVAFAVSNATRLVLEGELRNIVGRKRLEKKIKKLKDHYIICGFGRMGRLIARELEKKPAPFVVIERDTSKIDDEDLERYLIMEGAADKDETLVEAGIERAKGIITVVSTDAENLYIVLTARGLNPNISIVARAGEEGSEQKLIRAGANKVISPYLIGAHQMAQAVVRPAVLDFLEFATQSENLELQMEEVPINHGSSIAGLALKDCGIRQDLGIIILAIKRVNGEMEFNPNPTSVLHEGDHLIALGRPTQMKVLEEITMGR